VGLIERRGAQFIRLLTGVAGDCEESKAEDNYLGILSWQRLGSHVA